MGTQARLAWSGRTRHSRDGFHQAEPELLQRPPLSLASGPAAAASQRCDCGRVWAPELGFEAQLHHSLAVRFGASCLTSLNLFPRL